jgi:hypothetical protein
MSPEAREHSFDELTRGLASGSISRGKALRLMGAALVGGTLASLPGTAWAARCRSPRIRCRGQCCATGVTTCVGTGRNKTCACVPIGGSCAADSECCSGICDGTCGCKAAASTCTADSECCSGNCNSGTCSACPTGKVELSNGTCATPCGPPCDGGRCGGSPCACLCQRNFCSQFDPNAAFCSDDMECPVGYFCNDNQCQVVCEGAPAVGAR